MELKTGLIQHISKRTRRITANNPGVFTGPGTNTYLLGNNEVIIIDPGPALETHYNTIIGAAKRDPPTEQRPRAAPQLYGA